jgi:hypothetical protein
VHRARKPVSPWPQHCAGCSSVHGPVDGWQPAQQVRHGRFATSQCGIDGNEDRPQVSMAEHYAHPAGRCTRCTRCTTRTARTVDRTCTHSTLLQESRHVQKSVDRPVRARMRSHVMVPWLGSPDVHCVHNRSWLSSFCSSRRCASAGIKGSMMRRRGCEDVS